MKKILILNMAISVLSIYSTQAVDNSMVNSGLTEDNLNKLSVHNLQIKKSKIQLYIAKNVVSAVLNGAITIFCGHFFLEYVKEQRNKLYFPPDSHVTGISSAFIGFSSLLLTGILVFETAKNVQAYCRLQRRDARTNN